MWVPPGCGVLGTVSILLLLVAVEGWRKRRGKAMVPDLRFHVVGDWGCECKWAVKVAQAMEREAAVHPIDFVGSTGDMFYPRTRKAMHHRLMEKTQDLITDEKSDRFRTTFQNIFSGNALQVPWYMALGNHDLFHNLTALQVYSGRRWNLPNLYYSVTRQGRFSNTTYRLVFTCSELVKQYFSPNSFNFTRDQAVIAEQHWNWLVAELEGAKEDWLFVFGHDPIYSSTIIGEEVYNNTLMANLVPLFERSGVNAYFNGHHHVQQAFAVNQVIYWTSGSGGGTHNPFAKYQPSHEGLFQFFDCDHGFTSVTSFRTFLVLSAIRFDSRHIVTIEIMNRRVTGPSTRVKTVPSGLATLTTNIGLMSRRSNETFRCLSFMKGNNYEFYKESKMVPGPSTGQEKKGKKKNKRMK